MDGGAVALPRFGAQAEGQNPGPDDELLFWRPRRAGPESMKAVWSLLSDTEEVARRSP